jgi:uncharacterized protein (DUF1778 family)
MPATKTTKSEKRMSFRLPEKAKRRIEKAAIASGLTVTDFAIDALVTRADEVLEKHEVRVLTDRDRDIFLAMLDSPALPNEALKEAARRYKEITAE